MSNNKNEEKEKEGSFDPGCVADIYDKLDNHSYVLRALGALLRSSALDDFADPLLGDTLKSDNFEAANLRWGLSQIIDLYLAHQERILKEYVNQYHESDTCLVKWAKSAIDMVEHDAFTTKDAAINKLREAMEHLDIVINRGGELKEKATELKETCMGYLKRLAGKAKEGG